MTSQKHHDCFILAINTAAVKKRILVYWLLPLMLTSMDAHAWGLTTHIYFAHSLLWAMPALDSRFRRAIIAYPKLVMAGACLPDLSIMNKAFTISHQWQTAFTLLRAAQSDQERAIAVGYISHLYIDVIAHHHFVPAHEAIWFEQGMWGHILSEWAMDGYLQPLTEHSVGHLLSQEKRILASFLSDALDLPRPGLVLSLNKLIFWDKVLRVLRLPQLIHGFAHRLDQRTQRHFTYYLAQTQIALQQFQSVLDQQEPRLEAELYGLNAVQLDFWRSKCLHDLHLLNPRAVQHF